MGASQKIGVRSVLVTGESVRTARGVGKALGITDVHADVLPESRTHRRSGSTCRLGNQHRYGPRLDDWAGAKLHAPHPRNRLPCTTTSLS